MGAICEQKCEKKLQPVTAEDCLVAIALRMQSKKGGCTVKELVPAFREMGCANLAADPAKIQEALSRNVGLWQVARADVFRWELTSLGETHVDVLYTVNRALARS